MLKLSINLKTNLLYLFCKTILKPVNSDKIVYNEEICIESSKIDFVSSSSFNIFKVNIDESTLYFRECKQHIKFKNYIKSCLDDYFLFYHNEELINNKELIYKELLSRKTLKRLYNMGTENNIKSYTYKFFESNKLEVFNLEKLNLINFNEIFKLLNYIKGNVNCYRFNSGIPLSNYEVFSLNKSMAYITLSELLGLRHLIPDTKIVKLNIDNKYIKYGTLMNSTTGISPIEMSLEERNKITPNLQRELNNLNLLDTLAIDKDHRPSNYMVNLKDSLVDSFQVFDIDYPTSFFITSKISMITGLESGPFVNGENYINLPFLDEQLIKNLTEIKFEDLNNKLNKYLSKLQIYFLNQRIERMKKAVNHSLEGGKLTLLKRKQWNNETINKELNNEKNVSYLKIFTTDKCR